jgi:uncharacterized protein YndB with AHSA1/START domain
MARSTYVYVSYIRTTPEKLWSALTDSQFIRQYWFGVTIASEWKSGAKWDMTFPDGRPCDTGEILEIEPPKRMVIKWQNVWNPEFQAEGPSRCTMELEPEGSAVKLTITHEIEREASKLITAVSGGWPKVISNLKSLLECGSVALDGTYPKR